MFHQQIPQLSNEPIPQSATITNDMSPINERPLENKAEKKIYQNLWQILHFLVLIIKKSLPFVLIIVFIYFIYKTLLFQPQSGYIYHYEDPWWGTQMYNQVGIYIKIPFISRITRYNQAWTVSFGSRMMNKDSILREGPLKLTFSDSYTATMPATFRYRLSNNKAKLDRIHGDFTEFHNLVNSVLIPISEDVMVNTAMQYQGEEFFTGGINQFKTVLKDQLQYGLYKNEPQDRIISSDKLRPYKTTRQWKLLKNDSGEFLRMDNPLEIYGIEVTQIDLGVPIPETELQTLLDDKKRFDRIANEKTKELALVQEEEKIQLAQIEKVKKIQLAQIEKEQEIELAQIAKQQNIELAQIKKEQEIENAKGHSISLKKPTTPN